MSCITNKLACLLLCCTAWLGLGGASAAVGPEAESEADRYLTVRSEGYSRYEIDGDNVVAFFTEGVEFDYLGFQIDAGQLRYNHANQVATVNDAVTIQFNGIEAKCNELVLDGAAGQLAIEGGITGNLTDPPVTLTCQALTASFPPGARQVDVADIAVNLSGEVQVRDADGNLFRTDALSYEGTRQQVATIGGFRIDLAEIQPDSTDSTLPDLSGLYLTGTDLTADLIDGAGVNSFSAKYIVGDSSGLRFNAGALHVRNTAPAGTALTLDTSAIDIADFSASMQTDDKHYSVTSQTALVTLDDAGLSSLLLSDAVHVSLQEGEFDTDELLFNRVDDGFTFDLPSDLVFDFDLSAVSGISPISLDSSQGTLGGF